MVDMRASAAALLLMLGGCGGKIAETHYFASVETDTNRVVNVFRVRLKGSVKMANARYLAGYYDERAVDLFFNEVKSSDLTTFSVGQGVSKIFYPECVNLEASEACRAAYTKRLETIPVGTTAGNHGAFVMILSTDADAVASTIGSLAEGSIEMQSVLYLATKGSRDKANAIAATAATTGAVREATFDSMAAIANSSDITNANQRYLAILRAAAIAISPDAPPVFTSFDDAKTWFRAQPRALPQ